MSNYSGDLSIPKKAKIAVVISRFNALITDQLLSGARDGLTRCGMELKNIDEVWVPGAFEIPAVAKKLADSKNYDGVICLGAVIRGSTPHFDFVAGECAKGVANIAQSASIPVVFSVLTTDSIEQALERAGTKAGNKGFDGALTMAEMISLYSKLP